MTGAEKDSSEIIVCRILVLMRSSGPFVDALWEGEPHARQVLTLEAWTPGFLRVMFHGP